jgi:predicted metal-dependent phosphotriesterase family hydrolase
MNCFIYLFYLFIYFISFQYSPQTSVNIIVATGFYQESSWEFASGRSVVIKGAGKQETFITAGIQHYDAFISTAVGL